MSEHGVTVRQLRYLVAVADELHFGHAASAMHVTQSALSQQIQQLEQRVGAKLLERDRRSVALTEAGTLLVTEARRILIELDRAVELVRYSAQTPAQLRVGFHPTIETWFISLLIDGMDEHGRLDDYLWLRGIGEVPNAEILSGQVDVALTRHFAPVAGLEHETLLLERAAVYLAADDPLATLETVPLAALSGRRVRLVHRDFNPLLHEAFRHDAETAAPGLRLDPTLGFARRRNTQGIAEHEYVVLGFATSGPIYPGLAVVPLADAAPIPLTLVWRAGDERPALVRLREHARAAARSALLPAHVRPA
jgi:DNA-binding transcriptional LysR family regulator